MNEKLDTSDLKGIDHFCVNYIENLMKIEEGSQPVDGREPRGASLPCHETCC